MNWVRISLAALSSGVVSSMTDWLFMGDWLYKRYDRHPEIWRYRGGQGEAKAIIWASLLPFLTCTVFALVCARLHLFSYSATLKLALAIWLIGPLPLTIANGLFVKFSLPVVVAHAFGWLVKLVVAAIAVALILG
ncbi:MAG: hypothetical protein ACRD2S_04700 [Terriglobales bacterium]